jgi:hypothetical protein
MFRRIFLLSSSFPAGQLLNFLYEGVPLRDLSTKMSERKLEYAANFVGDLDTLFLGQVVYPLAHTKMFIPNSVCGSA